MQTVKLNPSAEALLLVATPAVKVAVVVDMPEPAVFGLRAKIAVAIIAVAAFLLFVAVTWPQNDTPSQLSRFLGGGPL